VCTVSFAASDQKVVPVSLVIAILHSHLVNKCEEIPVKTSATTVILVLLSTAAAFAESPKQLGAWSIYTAKDNHVVLLQSTSTAQGDPAKLDVICRNGKLSTIALEPSVAIEKNALSFTAVVPTTRVAYSLEGKANPNNGRSRTTGARFLPIPKSLRARSHGAWPSASPARRPWVFNWTAKLVNLWVSPPSKLEGWPRLCPQWDAVTDTYWG
jgi:hypothetical protein